MAQYFNFTSMRKFFSVAVIGLPFILSGQALSSLNVNYWYDPNAEIEFVISPVRSGNLVQVFYQMIANRKDNPIESYAVSWEIRESLSDKNGDPVKKPDSIISKSSTNLIGSLTLEPYNKLWYLLAKVKNTETQTVFYFYKPIDPIWPVNSFILANDAVKFKGFVPIGSKISLGIKTEKPTYCFLYKKKFGAAQPSFASAIQADPFLKADSTFTVDPTFVPNQVGLYLLQEDTASSQGVSFLVTDSSYPKFTNLSTLSGPLIYITTDDEYKQLIAAQTNKPAFDKVILEITRDKERAKNLMRSYFQRVEATNRYFTEYKEGWKTDRGVIYIIYGLPDEVSRTQTSETWFFRNQKAKFVFNKTGSVFCPENYKLQRERKFAQDWFTLVDLWRKSRF